MQQATQNSAAQLLRTEAPPVTMTESSTETPTTAAVPVSEAAAASVTSTRAVLGDEGTTTTGQKPADELRVLLAEVMPAYRQRWGNSSEFAALLDFQKILAQHNWTAPAWPVEIGGRGLSLEDQIACDAEFNRAGAPRQVAVYGVNNVGPTIAAAGTPEQKKHLLGITSVSELWCQGFSEPDSGSDLASLACKAEADEEGFTINGQKVWTSIGEWATHCMLLVRTDPTSAKHKGISVLLVPLDLPGIIRRPIRQIDGGAEFAEMFFDDVWVPKTALLGPLNEGWRVTMTTLGFERANVIAMAGQLADTVFTTINDPRVKTASASLRETAIRLYSDAKMLTWMGQRSLAGDGMAGGASSIIKLSWSKLGQRVSEFRVDLAGLEAVTGLDPAATHDFLHGRASTIAGGTTEVMKNLIGERNLGLPREPGR
jgi:alkylation response protein AidB-like acyl-CoA dehydrogenase